MIEIEISLDSKANAVYNKLLVTIEHELNSKDLLILPE